jgi:hypothetical protein
MSPTAQEIIGLAHRYCELIEVSGAENPSWLKDIAMLLPSLHTAVESLDRPMVTGSVALTPDLDTRFELYTHLVTLLGDRDAYWTELDRADDPRTMTGSLADDLTDIYCELKHGLHRVDEDPEYSLRAWAEGFARHWNQHLTDAQRHIEVLHSQGRLEESTAPLPKAGDNP